MIQSYLGFSCRPSAYWPLERVFHGVFAAYSPPRAGRCTGLVPMSGAVVVVVYRGTSGMCPLVLLFPARNDGSSHARQKRTWPA